MVLFRSIPACNICAVSESLHKAARPRGPKRRSWEPVMVEGIRTSPDMLKVGVRRSAISLFSCFLQHVFNIVFDMFQIEDQDCSLETLKYYKRQKCVCVCVLVRL